MQSVLLVERATRSIASHTTACSQKTRFRKKLRRPRSQTISPREGSTTAVLYESTEIRDAVIRSGMEHGAAERHDKLAELLPSIAR